MKTSIFIVIGYVALTLVGFGYPTLSSAEAENKVEQMIAEAKTPDDQKAITNFYEEAANAARQKQVQHERMKDSYQSRYPIKRAAMVPHCESLIKQYKDMAESYAALAKLHKDMATAEQWGATAGRARESFTRGFLARKTLTTVTVVDSQPLGQ